MTSAYNMTSAVAISGITRIEVIRLKDHPNNGVWLELSDRCGQVAWVSVWIDRVQLADYFESLAGFLRNIDEKESLRFLIKDKDAPIPEAETAGM